MFRKALVVSGPTRFGALSFKDGIAEGFKMAKKLGYDAVEIALRDPALFDLSEIGALSHSLSLPVVALGTGQAYVDEGLSLTSPDPGVRSKAAARLKSHIDFAAALGAQVIIGLIRGRKEEGMAETLVRRYLVQALKDLSLYGKAGGVRLALEPVNRYESDLVNNVDEALALLGEVGMDNLVILLDTFHMNIEEANMEESFRRAAAAARLGHVHLADSNRRAPGLGHIDFASLINVLREIGYRGALSLEILPQPDPQASARLALSYLKEMGV